MAAINYPKGIDELCRWMYNPPCQMLGKQRQSLTREASFSCIP